MPNIDEFISDSPPTRSHTRVRMRTSHGIKKWLLVKVVCKARWLRKRETSRRTKRRSLHARGGEHEMALPTGDSAKKQEAKSASANLIPRPRGGTPRILSWAVLDQLATTGNWFNRINWLLGSRRLEACPDDPGGLHSTAWCTNQLLGAYSNSGGLSPGSMDNSLLGFLLTDLKEGLRLAANARIIYVKREANRVAHSLAQFALYSMSTGFMPVGSPPVEELILVESNDP
ncbi:hypothetical protein ACLB2K_032876 [Fragaria x ananassa]